MAIQLAEHAVVIRSPWQDALGFARHRFEHRPGAAAELNAVAAHKPAREIGIVKLLAPQAGRGRPVAVGRLLDVTVDLRIGVEHQILADQPAGIRQPVGKAARCRIQQQPRRTDAVAGDDHDLRCLKLLAAVLVVIDHP